MNTNKKLETAIFAVRVCLLLALLLALIWATLTI